MARIGFLGIGAMGIGMADRLVRAGHEVAVFNRTAEKTRPLVEKGARLALTPRDAAESADAIISMVGDDEASEHVWLGSLDGALAANLADDAIIIECSTLSYDWVMELSSVVRNAGYIYIDSPVTGYPDMAAMGKLTLFVGAHSEDLEQARLFLKPLCAEIIHFGNVGQGTIYKLTINLIGSVQIAGVAEGLVLAEKAGLDMEIVGYAISKGAAASPQVLQNSKRMISGNHKNNIVFPGSWRLKDTIYGIRLAEKFDANAEFGNVAKNNFQILVDSGHGTQNESKVMDVIRKKK